MIKAYKNYFPLPNEIFSLNLCPGEIAVYSYLLYCEDRKTYQCYPSYKTIGQAVGMRTNTVQKYIFELADKGFIEIESTSVITKSGQKRNGSNLYTIRPIQEVVELYHHRQLRRLEESVPPPPAPQAGRIRGKIPLSKGDHRVSPCEPVCGPSITWDISQHLLSTKRRCEPFVAECGEAGSETFPSKPQRIREDEGKTGESPGAFAAPG